MDQQIDVIATGIFLLIGLFVMFMRYVLRGSMSVTDEDIKLTHEEFQKKFKGTTGFTGEH